MAFFRFGGVPVACNNVKIKQKMGRILYDQPCIHFDVEADFIIFKPTVGCTLRGNKNNVLKAILSFTGLQS